MNERPQILIVGAGPVGLSAAVDLSRAGIPIRIIDKLTEPANQSRAAIVHARTLEHFERVGIVEDFLAVGVKVHGASIYGSGNVLLVRPSFDHVPSPYPFLLGLEQFKTESLLTARLSEAGVAIERGVELIGFHDHDGHVSVNLRHADGTTEAADFAYVIGTDGGHSTVRTGLGLTLEGETLDQTWITADVKIKWDRDPGEFVAFLAEDGIAFIAAMNDGRWRVIVTHSKMTREEAEAATLDDVQRLVNDRFGTDIPLYDPVWISAFGINTRMAATMNVGRVFLAGDAAHVHSPVGGQGMNTGIQDALNLTWKLALVLKGEAKPGLLASYNAERHANAKRLLQKIGAATRMASLRSPVAIGVRNNVIRVLSHIGLTRVMPQVATMLDVGYPDSPAVKESKRSWFNRGPRAGDRAPDAPGVLLDGHAESQHLFTQWAGDARHQLLVFGDAVFPASPLYSIVRVLREGDPAPGVVIDPDGHAHEVYAVHENAAIYLVRPDGIIAFRSDEPDAAALADYLAEWYETP